MANVPGYRRSIGVQSPGAPQVRVDPMTPAASPAGALEAAAGIGKAITNLGSVAGEIIAQKSRLDAEEAANEATVKSSLRFQQQSKGDNGWLTREGANAKGITVEMERWAEKERQDLLKGRSEAEQKLILSRFNTHSAAWHEAVLSHEAGQHKVARDQAYAASAQANANTYALDPGKNEPVLNQAKLDLVERYAGQPKEFLEQKLRELTDQFAHTAVQANIQKDPAKAEAALDSLGASMNADKLGALRSSVDGKMMAVRGNFMWAQLEADPNARFDDKTYRLGYVEDFAKQMSKDRPEGEQNHYVNFVKNQAQMADSALSQAKKDSARLILDEFSKARDNGTIFPDADEAIMSKYTKVFSPSEIGKLRASAVEVYKRSDEATSARLSVMTEDQKLAHDDVVKVLRAKFGTQKVTLPGTSDKMLKADAIIRRFDQLAPAMQPEQMREWVKTQLESVPTKPPFVTILGYEMGTGQTPRWLEQTKLVNQYGAANVKAAEQALIDMKRPLNYVDLEKLLAAGKPKEK